MKMIWKYLPEGEVRHQFYTETSRTSVCRINNSWSAVNAWKDDAEGLAKRRECKLCPTARKQDEERDRRNARQISRLP